jgi:hypothetical protein
VIDRGRPNPFWRGFVGAEEAEVGADSFDGSSTAASSICHWHAGERLTENHIANHPLLTGSVESGLLRVETGGLEFL